MTIGYCSTCRWFRYHAAERPVIGLARFGRCRLGVRPIVAMCERWTARKVTR